MEPAPQPTIPYSRNSSLHSHPLEGPSDCHPSDRSHHHSLFHGNVPVDSLSKCQPSYPSSCHSCQRNSSSDARRHWLYSNSKLLTFLSVVIGTLLLWTQFPALGLFRSTLPSPANSAANSWPFSSPQLDLDRVGRERQYCRRLQQSPASLTTDTRSKNPRYLDADPVFIRNATVAVFQQTSEQSKNDIWIQADVVVAKGLVQRVAPNISLDTLPKNYVEFDAKGRPLTAGLIDMHSHVGTTSLMTPDYAGIPLVHNHMGRPSHSGYDGMTSDHISNKISPARDAHGLLVLDPQWQTIKSGGVTTSLVFPSTIDPFGSEGHLLKHAIGPKDGRRAISVADMLADQNQTWHHVLLACPGERYRDHRSPSSLKEKFRAAAELVQRQDDWCRNVENNGVKSAREYLPSVEPYGLLASILRNQSRVHVECDTIHGIESFTRLSQRFGFSVTAFHKAHQAYLIPDIVRQATSLNKSLSVALFADNMYDTQESYIASEAAGRILYEKGIDPVYMSDHPTINAQRLVFEAAKAHKFGLPYSVSLASVTATPARHLGVGNQLGQVAVGYDADLVLWDSDPLSVGATPAQVWIDGVTQFPKAVVLDKIVDYPLDTQATQAHNIDTSNNVADVELENNLRNARLGDSLGEAHHNDKDIVVEKKDMVVITGIAKVLASSFEISSQSVGPVSMILEKGKVVCVGDCQSHIQSLDASHHTLALQNGYVVDAFTAFGTQLGLSEMTREPETGNGPVYDTFSRAVDALQLGTKKLDMAHKYGVYHAISAPSMEGQGGQGQFGTSVGFNVEATLEDNQEAPWYEDAALHYSLLHESSSAPAYSVMVSRLRTLLLEAVGHIDDQETPSQRYSEEHYLRQVVRGELALVVRVHQADLIASLVRVKSVVESALEDMGSTRPDPNQHKAKAQPSIRLVIHGGAEAHLVAAELAKANVGVILSPYPSLAGSAWHGRRSLPGAPLTNGTTLDRLLEAGVTVALGVEEDWEVRGLGLLAGIALRNSLARKASVHVANMTESGWPDLRRMAPSAEKEAMNLISTNLYKILGISKPDSPADQPSFVLYEGSPFSMEGRVRAHLQAGRVTFV